MIHGPPGTLLEFIPRCCCMTLFSFIIVIIVVVITRIMVPGGSGSPMVHTQNVRVNQRPGLLFR